MASFERLLDPLPSLYRPDGDDAAEEDLPLLATDVVELNGQPPPAGSLANSDGAVIATLPARQRVQQIRLAPERSSGYGFLLELYRVDGHGLSSIPGTVARVVANVATLSDRFEEQRFALRLKRSSLLTLFLRSIADGLENADRLAADVLQSHWFAYADRAMFSPYFLQARRLLGQPPPKTGDRLDSPYIHDLARLARLLLLPPWQQPPSDRETVEEYRERVTRIVELHKNGLGTVRALRSMVEAQLPLDHAQSFERRDRPFILEEFSPLVTRRLAVDQTPGKPADMVGPLMRWTMENDGLESAPPTLYVQGVEPVDGLIDATRDPMIELYRVDTALPRLGIAYRGTVAPDQTLRLRPAYRCWVGLENGIWRGESLPTESSPADPTAAGPWQVAAGAPEAAVVALLQTHDRTLWAATMSGDAGSLWRHDGRSWTEALSDLPVVHCLAQDEQDLLVGTAEGLLRVTLYPEGDAPFSAAPVAGLAGHEVFCLLQTEGGWYAGTDSGVVRLDAGDSAAFFGLGEVAATATEVYALSRDSTGALYFGTALGLFQYQPGPDHWYWFAGEERAEQARDWQPYFPRETGARRQFPGASKVFLPPVRCVHRGPDASLWLGTDAGIARYLARPVRGLSFETVLEAFPELMVGRVYAIREDARGLIWFCTERGLFRYDGRDWWQLQGDQLVRLGRADRLHEESQTLENTWRFRRISSRWQRFDADIRDWVSYTGAPLSADQPAARVVAWTDSVAADLGQWDGTRFSSPTAVPGTALLMRYKPSEQRIVSGGLPAVPRLPVGSSLWRYLSLEPGDLVESSSRPAWTIEGRLLPPPPDLAPAPPGRYDLEEPPPPSDFDGAVFAFNPATRVGFQWEARRPLTALVRLKRRAAGEQIDPAVLDRVWQGIDQARPAGVRVMLAVEEEIVRGGGNGEPV